MKIKKLNESRLITEDFSSITSLADDCGKNTFKVSNRDIRFTFENEDDKTEFVNKLLSNSIPHTELPFGVVSVNKSSALDESRFDKERFYNNELSKNDITIKYGNSAKEVMMCAPIKVNSKQLKDYKNNYSFVNIVDDSEESKSIEEGYREDSADNVYKVGDRVAQKWTDEFNVGIVVDIKEDDGTRYLVKWDYADGPDTEWLYGSDISLWIEESKSIKEEQENLNETKESEEAELITQYINNGEFDKLEKVQDGTNVIWKLKEPVEEGYELNPDIDIAWRPYDNEKGQVMADKWYASKWPDDEVGIEQLKGITLDDALKDRSILDHCDTQVRERVYAQLDKYIPLSVDSPMYKEVNESNEDSLKVGDKVFVTVNKKNGRVKKIIGDYITVETDNGVDPIRIDTYYADEVKKLDESITEDVDIAIEEGPKEGPEFGLSSLLNEAIQEELKTIDNYNSLAITARSEGYEEIAALIDEINTEENKHIGQLQEALKSLSPNALAIEDGEAEGQEQLSNMSIYDDDLSDDELGTALFKLR